MQIAEMFNKVMVSKVKVTQRWTQ